MNVFKVAHWVNDRLNDGDKNIFPVMFTIVNELLSSNKIIGSFIIKVLASEISKGTFDEEIMFRINTFEEYIRPLMFDD